MTYDLLYPLEERKGATQAAQAVLDGERFESLTFAPMKVEYYLALDEVEGAHARNLKLLSLLTGKSKRALLRLDPRDYLGACKALDAHVSPEKSDD